MRRAERSRGQDELHFADLQHLRARQPRVARPACHRQGEDDLIQSRPEKCGKRNGQENSRKREKRIDQDNVYEAIERPAEISGKRAERQAHNSRSEHDRHSDQQRNSRAIQRARQNIAAQVRPFPSSDARSAAAGVPASFARRDFEARATAPIRPSEQEEALPQDPTGQVRWYAGIVASAMLSFISYSSNVVFILFDHCSLTLGSTIAYTKSVSRFTTTYDSAITRMQPCSNG